MEERYFTDSGNTYLITMENDTITDFKMVCPYEAIYFGNKNRRLRNYNDKEEVNSLIDSFYKDKVFNSREELEETTKQMVEELHKKDIAILPFGKFEHSQVSLLPFGERCHDWKWEGTDLAGFTYMTKDVWNKTFGIASIEKAEEQLKETLKTWNALQNGEVYECSLYKVVPNGEKYDSYSMDTKGENKTLCYNEDLGSQNGIFLNDSNCWDTEKAMKDFLRDATNITSNVKLYSSLEDLKKENNLKVDKSKEM